MIISNIQDRFGNQLFMCACGYAAARKQGGKFVLDETFLATNNLRRYELGGLNIKYDYLLYIPQKWPYFVKVVIRKFLQVILIVMTKSFKEKNT